MRVAIGASTRDIIRLIFREAMPPLAIGLGAGVIGSAATNRLFESQLGQISPWDPMTFLGTSAMLIGCAAIGCFIPARRATRVDPLIALGRG